jgi:predicted ArsR family transcriptional regulator
MPEKKPANHGDPLTERQQDTLNSICEAFLRGQPPSVRELGAMLGIGNPNGVMIHLTALVEKGALVPTGQKGDARRYRPAVLPCPHCGRNLYESE